ATVGTAVGRSERLGEAEHRPHGVADGVVQLAGASRVRLVLRRLGHGLILPRAAKPPPGGPTRSRPGSRHRRTPRRTAPAPAPPPPRAGCAPPGRGGRRRTAAAR